MTEKVPLPIACEWKLRHRDAPILMVAGDLCQSTNKHIYTSTIHNIGILHVSYVQSYRQIGWHVGSIPNPFCFTNTSRIACKQIGTKQLGPSFKLLLSADMFYWICRLQTLVIAYFLCHSCFAYIQIFIEHGTLATGASFHHLSSLGYQLLVTLSLLHRLLLLLQRRQDYANLFYAG